MSYSNDWSISGITGLTSLKDCYQWNGTKRLYDFGMLRLKDGNLNQDNEVWVDSTIFPNSNLIKYYSIPKFFITSKNVSGVGYGLPNTEENSYKYSNNITYPNNSNDDLKNWGFKQYPNIPCPSWVELGDIYRPTSIVESLKYIGVLATKENRNLDLKIFTEEANYDAKDVATLKIPDAASIYNDNYGRVSYIKNDIINHFDYSQDVYVPSRLNGLILSNKNVGFTVEGFPVYYWGEGLDPNGAMHGYLDTTEYDFNNNIFYNEKYVAFIDNPSVSINVGYVYPTVNGSYTEKYYMNLISTSLTYCQNLRGSRATISNTVFVPFSCPNFRIYYGADGITQRYVTGSQTDLMFYYDLSNNFHQSSPTFHWGFIRLTNSSYSRDNPTSDTSFRGNYISNLSTNAQNLPWTDYDWNISGAIDKKYYLWRVIHESDSTTQSSGNLTIPLLYDQSDNDGAYIERSSKTSTDLTCTGLFKHNGQTISFPVYWSSEPKIWLREFTSYQYVQYALYFGGYKNKLTYDLMELYGKDFSLTIYQADQMTPITTINFSLEDFSNAMSSSVKKEYRSGSNGFNLYLRYGSLSFFGGYCYYVGLTEVINGTEYYGTDYEFNKHYFLPWPTRTSFTPTCNLRFYGGGAGQLQTLIGTYNGQTYSGTAVNNEILIQIPVIDGYEFRVTNVTFNSGYGLGEDFPETRIHSSDADHTISEELTGKTYSWSNVSFYVWVTGTGGSSTDTKNWDLHAPVGYITSITGYYINGGRQDTIQETPSSYATNLCSMDQGDEESDFGIAISVTNIYGETRTLTYGAVWLTMGYSANQSVAVTQFYETINCTRAYKLNNSFSKIRGSIMLNGHNWTFEYNYGNEIQLASDTETEFGDIWHYYAYLQLINGELYIYGVYDYEPGEGDGSVGEEVITINSLEYQP